MEKPSTANEKLLEKRKSRKLGWCVKHPGHALKSYRWRKWKYWPPGEKVMLNPEQVMLVQSSWAEVEPVAHKVGENFYNKLFELDESAASLFSGNMKGQSQTLMSMIGMAVGLLDHPGSIGPAMKELGARHTGYGVQGAHIAPFSEAILWAMEQELGSGFSPQIRSAWVATLEFLFTMMQKGQAPH